MKAQRPQLITSSSKTTQNSILLSAEQYSLDCASVLKELLIYAGGRRPIADV